MNLVPSLRRQLAAAIVVCVVVGLGAVTFAHPTPPAFVVIKVPTPKTLTVNVTADMNYCTTGDVGEVWMLAATLAER